MSWANAEMIDRARRVWHPIFTTVAIKAQALTNFISKLTPSPKVEADERGSAELILKGLDKQVHK